MDEELRRGLHAELANAMAVFCVRNTELESIHAGLVPVTRTGDYTDVFVIDADGRRMPWPDVSHFLITYRVPWKGTVPQRVRIPPGKLSLQPVAIGADDGGNDIVRSTSV